MINPETHLSNLLFIQKQISAFPDYTSEEEASEPEITDSQESVSEQKYDISSELHALLVENEKLKKDIQQLLNEKSQLSSPSDPLHLEVDTQTDPFFLNTIPFPFTNVNENTIKTQKPVLMKLNDTQYQDPYIKIPGYYFNRYFFPVFLPDNIQTIEELINKYKTQKDEIISLKIHDATTSSETQRLKNILSYRNEQVKSYFNKIKTLEADNAFQIKHSSDLYQKVNMLQEEILEIKNKQTTYKDVIAYFENNLPQTTSVLQWDILKGLFVNCHKDAKHHKYTKQFIELSFAIANAGPKAYRTLRKILPFPCSETIRTNLSKKIKNTEQSLLSLTKIAAFTKENMKNVSNSSKKMKATLAIDAIAVNSSFLPELKVSNGKLLLRSLNEQIAFTKEKLKKKECDIFMEAMKQTDATSEKAKKVIIDNIFIYYLEPFDANVQCFPIFMFLKHGGNADGVIRSLTGKVIHEIESTELISIDNISTDGDPGHQEIYDSALQQMKTLSSDLNLSKMLKNEKRFSLTHMASGDILHICKTLRIKFLLHNINLMPENSQYIIKCNEIQKILKKGIYLSDLSHIGKMKDRYVQEFFSMENLQLLIENNYLEGVFGFLPFVFLITSIMDENMEPVTSLEMLKIAYQFIYQMYGMISIPEENYHAGTKQINRGDPEYITIGTNAVMIRIMTTLFTLIINLEGVLAAQGKIDVKLPPHIYDSFASISNFGIERLGTHPLENLNGFIREGSHSYDSIMNACSVLARAHIQKQIQIKNDLDVRIKGRINAGGLKLSEFQNSYQTKLSEIDHEAVIKSFVENVSKGAHYKPDEVHKSITQLIYDIAYHSTKKETKTHPSPTAGSRITSRLIAVGKPAEIL